MAASIISCLNDVSTLNLADFIQTFQQGMSRNSHAAMPDDSKLKVWLNTLQNQTIPSSSKLKSQRPDVLVASYE